MTINKVKIERMTAPTDGYTVNAQVWASNDNGTTFAYYGNGKYFRTLQEALIFKAEVEEVTR